MNPMPAAAPSPRRNADGKDQNGGVKLYRPIAATDSSASARTGLCVRDADRRPAAATAAHAATCHLRSPVRSECDATVTIAAAANVNGTAVQSPTARSELPDRLFT